MTQKFILSLDQGTTSSRSIIFNKKGEIISASQKEFKQYYPKPGWVEHDPMEIWESQLETAQSVVRDIGNLTNIVGVGITNQRETTIVWDRNTGLPIYNAIVWQDKRTTIYCDILKEKGWSGIVEEKTGLVIDSYFSGTKLRWILKNVEGALEKARAGDLAFGTIDSWLIWRLTNGEKHLTDVTNASRTMMFNINTLSWDEELLELLEIPKEVLPEVRSSSEIYGIASKELLGCEIPIAGVAGDQQAALFGQTCFELGSVKNTYGTGCFMICNTGKEIIKSKNKMLATIAWQLNGETTYALEGSIFIAGAIVQWLRDGLGIISDSGEIENLARKVKDNGGIYLIPALTGLGSPHWDQNARGLIIGLTRGTTAAHIARAALESIAFQTNDVLSAMEADLGSPIYELRVDGGAVVNNLLMQFQADILNIPVYRPQTLETTALGAAYFSGLAVGLWKDMDEIKAHWSVNKCFKMAMDSPTRQKLLMDWKKALSRSMNWSESDEL